MQGGAVKAGFLGEFAFGGLKEIFAVTQEPAGQGGTAPEGLVGPLDDQDVQLVLPDGQDRQVDGEVQQETVSAGHAPKLTLMSS